MAKDRIVKSLTKPTFRDLYHVINKQRPIEIFAISKSGKGTTRVYKQAMDVPARYKSYIVDYVASGMSDVNKSIMLLVDIHEPKEDEKLCASQDMK